MRYTLQMIADAIATAEHRPDKERVHQQLRGLAARKLLKPIPDVYGRKGALLFSEIEAVVARVLLVAVDLGIAGNDADDFAAQIRFTGDNLDPTTGEITPRGIEAAITAHGTGNTWSFLAVRSRNDVGDPVTLGDWLINGHGSDDRDLAILEARIEIPISAIIAPLIAQLRAN